MGMQCDVDDVSQRLRLGCLKWNVTRMTNALRPLPRESVFADSIATSRSAPPARVRMMFRLNIARRHPPNVTSSESAKVPINSSSIGRLVPERVRNALASRVYGSATELQNTLDDFSFHRGSPSHHRSNPRVVTRCARCPPRNCASPRETAYPLR